MKPVVLALFVVLSSWGLPAVAEAQGSGSTGPGSPGVPRELLVVTRSINGTIAEMDVERRLIALTDEKGRRHEFRVVPETRFRADKGTELAEREEIDLPDFQPGWPVRFTFRPDDRYRVLHELKLRRVKK